MQKGFVTLAIEANCCKTIAELSHITGMDPVVLRTHVDAMVETGEVEKVKTDAGVSYKLRRNDI